MNERVRNRLLLLGAATLFSTGGAAIKAATITSWQVASFRSGIAALALDLAGAGGAARLDLETGARGHGLRRHARAVRAFDPPYYGRQRHLPAVHRAAVPVCCSRPCCCTNASGAATWSS